MIGDLILLQRENEQLEALVQYLRGEVLRLGAETIRRADETGRLKEALRKIEAMDDWCMYCGATAEVAEIAREALSGPDAETK